MKQPVLDVTRYETTIIDNRAVINPIGEKITDIVSCDVRLGIENIKDVFSFKVPTVLKKTSTEQDWKYYLGKKLSTNNDFKVGDWIKISAYYSEPDSDPDNNVLMYGEITDFSFSNEEDGPMININGANLTENFLRGFVISTNLVQESATNKVPQIIIAGLDRLNSGGLPQSKKVYAALDNAPLLVEGINITGTNGNIVSAPNPNWTAQSGSSTFKEVSYVKTWQPFYKILEDLAAPEYTGDEYSGNYIYYLKKTVVLPDYKETYGDYINELVFTYPSETVDTVLNRGEEYSVNSINKDVDEVVNVLIVKPGIDSLGVGITTYVVNPESFLEHGPKYSFWSKPEIANAIMATEKNDAEQAGITFAGLEPVSYPYTMRTISERDNDLNETNTYETVTNSQEYANAIRDEARAQGRIKAQRIVDKLGKPTYSCNMNLIVGSNNIGIGTVVEVEDKVFGWRNTTDNPTYKLRLRDIRHRFDNNGWNTQLVLKEDEKIISERLNQ